MTVLLFTFNVNGLSHGEEEPPSKWIKGIRITYYRPPAGLQAQQRSYDLYNSFLKDETGNLMIRATGNNRYVRTAASYYLGFAIKTAKGREIEIFQETPNLRREFKSNCHGFTFLDGEFWMFGSAVDRILDDNAWRAIPESIAQAGDVLVYREANGRVCHTARVTGRDADGVLIESKSGLSLARANQRPGSVLFN